MFYSEVTNITLKERLFKMPGLEDVYLEIYYNILVVEQVELKENKKPQCKYIS